MSSRISKAFYSLPPELFGGEQVTQRKGATPFERKLRALALKGYETLDAPDKELQRFMKPACSLTGLLNQDQSKSQELCYLGKDSWIASVEYAPVIPSACDQLLAAFEEPRSLLNAIGLQYTSIRIMYLAEDLNQIVLSSLGRAELLFIVIADGVTASFDDKQSYNGSYVRSIVGSLGQGANVRMGVDQAYSSDGYGMHHDRWYIANKAQLTLRELYTGSSQSWLRKEFMLAQEASVDYRWLSALSGTEQVALTTVQEHQGPNSKSSVLVKAALAGQARSFYRGMIRVDEESSQAEADQQQKALLLSKDAKICAIPALEVATHDVQCSHGSAAGQFNEDELWYLQSRGMGSEQSKKVLLEGFFAEEGNSPLFDVVL